MLDTFEAALDGVDVIALRPRLEHAQLMTKVDMARLGKLGGAFSVIPTVMNCDLTSHQLLRVFSPRMRKCLYD